MSIDIRDGRWQEALANVADASVRLLLTSPPYDNARTYDGTNDRVDFSALSAFARRVLVPGGTLAMVLDGSVKDGTHSTTPYDVLCAWAREPGWRFAQMLAYGRRGLPGAYAGRFRKDHEPLLVFHRDGGPLVCRKDRVAERAATPNGTGLGSERLADGTLRKNGFGRRATYRPEIRNRGSVWHYGSIGHGHDPSCEEGHPATFAEAFALDAVAVWTERGELVCDPFSGSGTVAAACKLTGRRFVGAERVPAYAEKSRSRVAGLAEQLDMFEAAS